MRTRMRSCAGTRVKDGSSPSTVSDQLTVLVSRSPEKDCCRATLKQKITRWLESISVNTGNTTRQYSTVVYRCTGVVFAIIITARGLLQRVPCARVDTLSSRTKRLSSNGDKPQYQNIHQEARTHSHVSDFKTELLHNTRKR